MRSISWGSLFLGALLFWLAQKFLMRGKTAA